MSRRMSCQFTIEAVRRREKTVTRRHVDTWRKLAPGDRLTLVEQAMGLPKGATQIVLAEVEVVDVRVEPLCEITDADVIAEGFPELDRWGFVDMFVRDHPGVDHQADPVRRIEWRYLDDEIER